MIADVQQEFQKWLKLFDRGVYTWREIVFRIALLAVHRGFFDCLKAFPEQLVADLREEALHAPGHPEDIFFIDTGIYRYEVTREEIDRADAAQRVLFYWSARALREHFFPELPHPEFVPVARVGVVEEAARIDGAVVLLFEESQWWLIRENPVHCITPGGERIAIKVVSTSPVKHNHEDSLDSFEREYGRHALTLDDDAPGPERFPAGTTVWVDRTNVAEIPSPELSD